MPSLPSALQSLVDFMLKYDFFLIYVTNHNQWYVMRMKTCMVLLTCYCIHTSETLTDGEWSSEKQEFLGGGVLLLPILLYLYIRRCGKISLYHIIGSWQARICTQWDGGVDYNLISPKVSSRASSAGPGCWVTLNKVLRCVTPQNED